MAIGAPSALNNNGEATGSVVVYDFDVSTGNWAMLGHISEGRTFGEEFGFSTGRWY